MISRLSPPLMLNGLALILLACTSLPGEMTPLSVQLKTHVAVLASDELTGRAVTTDGYDQAADYVVDVLSEAGVEPSVEGWRQHVPLMVLGPDSVSGELSIVAGSEALDLVPGENIAFVAPSDGTTFNRSAQGTGGVVFVGDGVVAPDLGLDPYAHVDVRGKIVAMFRGAPPIKDRATEVHVRRFAIKQREAAARGAVGILYIDPEGRSMVRLTRLRWSHPKGQLWLDAGLDRPMPTAFIDLSVGRELFEASGRDFDDALTAVSEGRAESFEMEAIASLSTHAQAFEAEAYNVVGVVPGTDPQRRHEAVVVTAHLDHLGYGHKRGITLPTKVEKGVDVIHNGALDNATGIAIMMEAASRLSAQGGARRTVIFAAVTAEEAGLLGSAHLARNVETLGYTPVANVNIDMPVLTYPLRDIIGFGEAYSSLADPLREAAAGVGLVSTPDPLPEMSLFVRSDHYSFVQESIPSLFLFNGMSGEGQAGFQAFMAEHYHTPSDDMNLPIRWRDAAKLTRLSHDLIQRIANDPARPTWNDGVIFAPAASPSP